METNGDGGQGRGQTFSYSESDLHLPILLPLLPKCSCGWTFATLWVLISPTCLYPFNHLTLDRRETRRGKGGDDILRLLLPSDWGSRFLRASLSFTIRLSNFLFFVPNFFTNRDQQSTYPPSQRPSIYVPSEEFPELQMSHYRSNCLHLTKPCSWPSMEQVTVSCCGQTEAAPKPAAGIKMKTYCQNISVIFLKKPKLKLGCWHVPEMHYWRRLGLEDEELTGCQGHIRARLHSRQHLHLTSACSQILENYC